jgi:hypothetical protein
MFELGQNFGAGGGEGGRGGDARHDRYSDQGNTIYCIAPD